MTVVILLPIFAAIAWGLHYLFIERSLEQVNAGTFWLLSATVQMILAVCILAFGPESFSVKPVMQHKFFWFFALTILTGVIAEACTLYAIAGNGAAYAAFGELAYPLFILLFGFLIYGQTGLSVMQIIGGGLILLGAVLLSSFK